MKDQRVIITGGSSGIGKAAALEFAEQGAHVLITGRREAPLNEVALLNKNIVPIVADSASMESANFVVEKAVEMFGGIDVLVNNAGAGANASLEEITYEKVSEIFA